MRRKKDKRPKKSQLPSGNMGALAVRITRKT